MTTLALGDKKNVITTLQFLVGSLVTFGGASFVSFAPSTYGKTIGSIHLTIGLIGLIGGGYFTLKTRSQSRKFLLVINGLTIAYSSFSESLVYIQSLLPAPASVGSLIGTIIAIAMALGIISMLAEQKS